MNKKNILYPLCWGILLFSSCQCPGGIDGILRQWVFGNPQKEEICELLLQEIQAGHTSLLGVFLNQDAIWTAPGDPSVDPLAGTFHGLKEIKTYLNGTLELLAYDGLIPGPETLDGDKTTSVIRQTGFVRESGAVFELEYIYTCEFDESDMLTAVTVESNQLAHEVLFSAKEGSKIVSGTVVSPEARGLAAYFTVNLKEYFKSAGYQEIRALLDTSVPLESLPPGANLEQVSIAGIPGEIMRTPASLSDRMIVYFHGGAFVAGDMAGMRPVTYLLAAGTSVPVLAINYRRPPEDIFPAATADCLAVYTELLQVYDASNLILCGESAGGNLVFTTLEQAHNRGLGMPAAAVAFSPWLDLTNSSRTFTTNAASEAMLSQEVLDKATGYYLQGSYPPAPPLPRIEDSLVSPLNAEVNNFPPLYLAASNDEILLDDTLRMFAKLETANNETVLELGKGMVHAWPAQQIPEAVATINRAALFIKEKWGLD